MNYDRHRGLFDTDYPIIMAPMFLISNVEMIKAAMDAGITGAIPALNYRSNKELEEAILELKAYSDKPFGINLIVNKSNPKAPKQLEICLKHEVPYLITSLGNPGKYIEEAHKRGMKVFCDVTNLEYAKKVADQGADAVIAVNAEAGGHAGNITGKTLVEELSAHLTIPVISAGGVATHEQLQDSLDWGAVAVSVGTVFIASKEAKVTDEYKDALVKYGAKDIVRTTKMSGSALTVINTPYVQSIGTEASWLEHLMHSNRRLKRLIKMFIAIRGLNKVRKAANSATYKTVWVAGPSIEHIHAIKSCKEIIASIVNPSAD